PFRVLIQADLSAWADRLHGKAGMRRLGPPDARTIAVHHDLEVEQLPARVEAPDRVTPANDAAIVPYHGQREILPREIFERLERWPGELDATHVRRDVLHGSHNQCQRFRFGHQSLLYPKMQLANLPVVPENATGKFAPALLDAPEGTMLKKRQPARRRRAPGLAPSMRWLLRSRLPRLAFLTALGPGLISGFADNDAGGITTYSVVGAQCASDLMWLFLGSMIALSITQAVAARL